MASDYSTLLNAELDRKLRERSQGLSEAQFAAQKPILDYQGRVAQLQQGSLPDQSTYNQQQATDLAFANAEKILGLTGDPQRALDYVNKTLGTDLKYQGNKADWLLFGSDKLGHHAWNFRTKEMQTLSGPAKGTDKPVTWEENRVKYTKLPDGRVVTSPVDKPGDESGDVGKQILALQRTYNAYLNGIKQRVEIYLKPEDQTAIDQQTLQGGDIGAILAAAVHRSSLSTEQKKQVLSAVDAVNREILPKMAQLTGVADPFRLGMQPAHQPSEAAAVPASAPAKEATVETKPTGSSTEAERVGNKILVNGKEYQIEQDGTVVIDGQRYKVE